MNTAFQTLLSSVSDMGLNEGDFLRMNNLLKKAYDEDKKNPSAAATISRPIQVVMKFKDTMNKHECEFNLSEIIKKCDGRDPDRYFDWLDTISINGHFKSHAHTSAVAFKHIPDISRFIAGWITRVRPMTMTIALGDCETTYTFKSVLASCKAEDEEDDCDDDDFDYGYAVVMGKRFPAMISEMLRAHIGPSY